MFCIKVNIIYKKTKLKENIPLPLLLSLSKLFLYKFECKFLECKFFPTRKERIVNFFQLCVTLLSSFNTLQQIKQCRRLFKFFLFRFQFY